MSIGHTLKKTQHLMRIRLDEALLCVGISTPQYTVLYNLKTEPGLSNAELARKSYVTAQTMHGILNNLEKLNLLKRTTDPDNKRILRAQITSKGAKLVTQASRIINKVEAKMLESLSAQEIALLEALLETCSGNLHNANR